MRVTALSALVFGALGQLAAGANYKIYADNIACAASLFDSLTDPAAPFKFGLRGTNCATLNNAPEIPAAGQPPVVFDGTLFHTNYASENYKAKLAVGSNVPRKNAYFVEAKNMAVGGTGDKLSIGPEGVLRIHPKNGVMIDKKKFFALCLFKLNTLESDLVAGDCENPPKGGLAVSAKKF